MWLRTWIIWFSWKVKDAEDTLHQSSQPTNQPTKHVILVIPRLVTFELCPFVVLSKYKNDVLLCIKQKTKAKPKKTQNFVWLVHTICDCWVNSDLTWLIIIMEWALAWASTNWYVFGIFSGKSSFKWNQNAISWKSIRKFAPHTSSEAFKHVRTTHICIMRMVIRSRPKKRAKGEERKKNIRDTNGTEWQYFTRTHSYSSSVKTTWFNAIYRYIRSKRERSRNLGYEPQRIIIC